MKAKTIFRGAVASLMSMSLLLSGMPVMATDAGAAGKETQAQEQPAGSAAGKEAFGQAEGEKAQPGDSQQAAPDGQQEGTEHTNNEKADSGGQEGTGSEKDIGGREESDSGEETEGQEGTGSKKDGGGKEGADSKKDAEGKEDVDSEKDLDKKKDAESKGDADEKKDTEEAEGGITSFAAGAAIVGGSISIDGSLSDWAKVTARTSNASNADSWKVAYAPDGNTVYLCFSGTTSTEWDYKFTGNKFEFTYADGAAGEDSAISVAGWNGGYQVKNSWYGDINGASAAVVNEAHGNNAGPYTVEIAVPASFFHSPEFTVTFGGASVNAADIEKLDGNAVAEEVQPVYAGISIDGNYADWAAVAKADASCPNSAHPGCLSRVAAVYDGDWFYVYIKDGKDSNASGAGTHSNGKFAIVSDLGYETDIQLTTVPEVKGVNGAKVAYVGSEWEIAVPRDQLPKYEQSLSFHFYLGDVLVGNIMNLQPDSGNNLDNLFTEIIFDGAYEDWEDYGHATIEYATPGSQESQIDAKGALYSNGETLFGHVVTGMPQHLQEAGQEFTEAITIAFNQSQEKLASGTYDRNMVFCPRFVTVDASGNINWNPKLSGLPEGTYEYHIASIDAWHTSTNISNLNDMDQLYGRMTMTIAKDGKDEMEFYLDLPMIAKKLGVGETDLKKIAAQFGRIGQQWIFTAGTSTGPVAGVALCVAAVGVIFWYRKRKYGECLPVSA
ncbi:MAG: hypothetical protein HFH36_04325 [Lachnospiraceae bacterium]|nr:hypothetical protein [Lachnospiraceae bacterium]